MKVRTLLFSCSMITFFVFSGISKNEAGEEKKSETGLTKGSKILVVYYSRTGNTKKVAESIASMLNADIEDIVDKKDRSGAIGYMKAGKDAMGNKLTEIGEMKYDPADYNTVVIGTPVWG